VRTLAVIAVVLMSLGICLTAAASTSPDAYRSQAAAICKSTNKALAKIPAPKNAPQVSRYFDAVLPIFQAQYESLRRLSAPSSFTALVGQILAAEKTQLAGLRDLSDQIKRGANPVTALARMDKDMTAASNDEDRAWKKLKVSACLG